MPPPPCPTPKGTRAAPGRGASGPRAGHRVPGLCRGQKAVRGAPLGEPSGFIRRPPVGGSPVGAGRRAPNRLALPLALRAAPFGRCAAAFASALRLSPPRRATPRAAAGVRYAPPGRCAACRRLAGLGPPDAGGARAGGASRPFSAPPRIGCSTLRLRLYPSRPLFLRRRGEAAPPARFVVQGERVSGSDADTINRRRSSRKHIGLYAYRHGQQPRRRSCRSPPRTHIPRREFAIFSQYAQFSHLHGKLEKSSGK